jgi:hypothetical protein
MSPRLLFDYRRQHNLSIKVACIFNTYGPRMHTSDGRVVSNFIVQALKKQPITIFGEGQQSTPVLMRTNRSLILLSRRWHAFSAPTWMHSTWAVCDRKAQLRFELYLASGRPPYVCLIRERWLDRFGSMREQRNRSHGKAIREPPTERAGNEASLPLTNNAPLLDSSGCFCESVTKHRLALGAACSDHVSPVCDRSRPPDKLSSRDIRPKLRSPVN